MFAHLGMLDPVESSKIPLEVLGAGSLMLVIITLIHGAGLDRIVDHYRKRSQKLRERKRPPHLASFIFAYAILLMLFLHIAELGIWGVFLNVTGLIPNFRDSVYFSANTYTTIGYGKMILPESWRELSPIMAISGLFTFAWTTGQMFELVGDRRQLTEELTSLYRRKKVSGIASRKQEHPVKAKAMVVGLSFPEEEKDQDAGLSSAQRLQLRQEIEAKLRQLHEAEDYEIEVLRRREREGAE
jgi:ion channel